MQTEPYEGQPGFVNKKLGVITIHRILWRRMEDDLFRAGEGG